MLLKCRRSSNKSPRPPRVAMPPRPTVQTCSRSCAHKLSPLVQPPQTEGDMMRRDHLDLRIWSCQVAQPDLMPLCVSGREGPQKGPSGHRATSSTNLAEAEGKTCTHIWRRTHISDLQKEIGRTSCLSDQQWNKRAQSQAREVGG